MTCLVVSIRCFSFRSLSKYKEARSNWLFEQAVLRSNGSKATRAARQRSIQAPSETIAEGKGWTSSVDVPAEMSSPPAKSFDASMPTAPKKKSIRLVFKKDKTIVRRPLVFTQPEADDDGSFKKFNRITRPLRHATDRNDSDTETDDDNGLYPIISAPLGFASLTIAAEVVAAALPQADTRGESPEV